MALPKPVVPTYELVLPVSGKKVVYRPFVVKEDKILMLANESGTIKDQILATKQILASCTFGDVDIDTLAAPDAEYLFIKIRSKSVSEVAPVIVTCKSCAHEYDYKLNLEKVKAHHPKKVSPDIRISADTVITMKFPGIDSAESLEHTSPADIALAFTAKCIERITVGDDIYENFDYDEVLEYINNLTDGQIDMIRQFVDSIPKIVYEDKETKCPSCGELNPIRVEGIGNFIV